MKIKNREIYKLHAELCKTLANDKRLMIIEILSDQESSVGELATSIDVPTANISQHLYVLRVKNIVEGRKDGRTVYYRLVQPRLWEACLTIRRVLLEGLQNRGSTAHDLPNDPIEPKTDSL